MQVSEEFYEGKKPGAIQQTSKLATEVAQIANDISTELQQLLQTIKIEISVLYIMGKFVSIIEKDNDIFDFEKNAIINDILSYMADQIKGKDPLLKLAWQAIKEKNTNELDNKILKNIYELFKSNIVVNCITTVEGITTENSITTQVVQSTEEATDIVQKEKVAVLLKNKINCQEYSTDRLAHPLNYFTLNKYTLQKSWKS